MRLNLIKLSHQIKTDSIALISGNDTSYQDHRTSLL